MRLEGLQFDIGAQGWLVEAEYQFEGRYFYYRCRAGEQYVAELDPEHVEEMWELQDICLCEALGGSHDYQTYSGSRLCQNVWSEDYQFHKRIFELCLEHLLQAEVKL